MQTRFMIDEDTWPPVKPISFTPHLLIHHQGHRTLKELTTMGKIASLLADDKLSVSCHFKRPQSISDTPRVTKEINDMLAPLEDSKDPSFILIEGAPGIGKSVLLKEVAYRWGSKECLHKFELVLLVYLRDPNLQRINSVAELFRLFYIGDKNNAEIVSACSQYFLENGGLNLTFLLDGYNEYPANLLNDSLIADIIKRKVFPFCGLVISSRPHASVHLRTQATVLVDILGFPEAERGLFIQKSLAGRPHQIEELRHYLFQHPVIDSLCFIPFNIMILLYIYQLGLSLPENSTQLYHYFICSTIHRHLMKHGHALTHNITDLTDLPEPYNRIIRQLSRLSLEALNNNKQIFTLDEIKCACPDIAAIPGGINGFGLLEATQHFGIHMRTVVLNFIHLAVQEFLAAHYICHLPPDEELKVFEERWWSDIHFNMFSMYLSLTKGQRPSFKMFLSGGKKSAVISPKYLENQLMCLRLYYFFVEAGDLEMCNKIERSYTFERSMIDLYNIGLTANDVMCISIFLSYSSRKEWKRIDLTNCFIQDKGLHTLYRGLRHHDINIYELCLVNNGITAKSSSLISEVTVKFQLKVLNIDANSIVGEDEQLYSMLNCSSMLEQLHMEGTELSSIGAIHLFTSLRNNHKLKLLNISSNAITDDAYDAITSALKGSNSLVTLWVYANPLSSKTAIEIVDNLQDGNDVLEVLWLPDYPKDVQERIILFQKKINKIRESRGCKVKLEIKCVF